MKLMELASCTPTPNFSIYTPHQLSTTTSWYSFVQWSTLFDNIMSQLVEFSVYAHELDILKLYAHQIQDFANYF